MSYHGDIRLGDTIDIKFTSRRFSTGAPFTLAGTPAISAYVDNGTTEITAGITLTVDFDSRTGLNNVRVVATSGNGFATATEVQLVITAGTVDSVSVVGEVVGSFSIEHRVVAGLTNAAGNKIADHVRRRTQANVEASSDGDALDVQSAYGLIQQAQNSGPIASNSLPVRKQDGTSLGSIPTVSAAGAEPVTKTGT